MYLLDTDTVIFGLRGDSRVRQSLLLHETDPKAISVVTWGELFYGAMKSANPEAALAKVRRIAEIFPIIDASRGIMETFGSLKAQMEKDGKRADDFDLVIAATALAVNFTLVTNNERHFRHIPGLQVTNWVAAGS